MVCGCVGGMGDGQGVGHDGELAGREIAILSAMFAPLLNPATHILVLSSTTRGDVADGPATGCRTRAKASLHRASTLCASVT